MMCPHCQAVIDKDQPQCHLCVAALTPVRSKTLFGGKWTDSDLKAFATALCREVRRKYTREQAHAMCEEMAQLWDIGDDYLKPNHE